MLADEGGTEDNTSDLKMLVKFCLSEISEVRSSDVQILNAVDRFAGIWGSVVK